MGKLNKILQLKPPVSIDSQSTEYLQWAGEVGRLPRWLAGSPPWGHPTRAPEPVSQEPILWGTTDEEASLLCQDLLRYQVVGKAAIYFNSDKQYTGEMEHKAM